ncbi:MAG: exodeoxyribonuclease VII large subunit, partial [Vulcanimicrobiaceae bacterium]
SEAEARLPGLVYRRTRAGRDVLRALERRLEQREPTRQLAAQRKAHGALERALDETIAARLRAARERLADHRTRLRSASPEAILERGYAIVYAGGAIVRDPSTVARGTPIEAQLAKGRLRAIAEGPVEVAPVAERSDAAAVD